MGILDSLQPQKVFYYFEELSKLPHGSGNTGAVTEYLKAFASSHSLRCHSDEAGNVVIFADGTEGYESSPAVILQGHMDMVCVKWAESQHDFTKDPLALAAEGDEIYARDTSLGGDDGIAVAYMLAILDDPSAVHPPLDCVFTTDEETGLIGAGALDTSVLRGNRMINLDSEAEGVFTCGCAGGVRVSTILPISRDRIKGLPVVISMDGLLGGHSASMIATGRASANKLMGRYLYALQDTVPFSLEHISGGEKDNAIAASAKAHLVIDEDDYASLDRFTRSFEAEIRSEYAGIEPSFSVTTVKGDIHRISVIDPASLDKLIFVLLMTPYGVRELDGLVKGAVKTSSNPGIVRTTETEFICANLVRSSEESGKAALRQEIEALGAHVGGKTRLSGNYPGWPMKKTSPLRDKMQQVYLDLYGKEPVLETVHGGIECGLFSGKIAGFDAVSIGPDMKDIHSYNERLSVSSSARVYEYLLKLLAELK